MNQRQILVNRTLNFIETLRHQIYSTSDIQIYNDILIIKAIIPDLTKNTLRNLIQQLKPHNCNSLTSENHTNFQFTLCRIMRILSETEKPSHLLTDFLICAGYLTNPATCTS